MKPHFQHERLLLLYIPFLLSLAFSAYPTLSYFIAWLGSFFIFYITFTGQIRPLPKDLSKGEQFLRPVFLMQLIYAGYMAVSSIFYYLDASGYQYLTHVGKEYQSDPLLFEKIAQCQRYYILGHAAVVHGILCGMNYNPIRKYKLLINSYSWFLLNLSLISLALSYLFSNSGLLSQFSVQLHNLSFVSGTISLASAIREKKPLVILLASLLFVFNFSNALLSGFKEPIIVCVLLLGIFLIPVLGKKTYPLFGSALLVLFFVLPTFIASFRTTAFSNEENTAEEARDAGLNALFDNENLQEDLTNDNWGFLTHRLSEISMFTIYTDSTPDHIPYYGFQLFFQGIESLIPRGLWAGKPVTETLVMERVYNAGIVSRDSIVSAKPPFVVDSFLSGGMPGIWIALFLFGYTAQWLSQKAEDLFGGYFLGTAVIYIGLFQIFWRGNSYEFVFNSVFWSFISMLIIFSMLRHLGYLVKNSD